MIEEIKAEDKFTTIKAEDLLPFPEHGDIINDGEKDLVVCAVEVVDNKHYALVFEEETKNIALYEVSETPNSFEYSLVHDNTLFGKVLLNIINKSKKEGE